MHERPFIARERQGQPTPLAPAVLTLPSSRPLTAPLTSVHAWAHTNTHTLKSLLRAAVEGGHQSSQEDAQPPASSTSQTPPPLSLVLTNLALLKPSFCSNRLRTTLVYLAVSVGLLYNPLFSLSRSGRLSTVLQHPWRTPRTGPRANGSCVRSSEATSSCLAARRRPRSEGWTGLALSWVEEVRKTTRATLSEVASGSPTLVRVSVARQARRPRSSMLVSHPGLRPTMVYVPPILLLVFLFVTFADQERDRLDCADAHSRSNAQRPFHPSLVVCNAPI